MRRSEMPPSSAVTIPRRSRAKATGSPWKFPQLRILPRSAKMRGLSVAEFTSTSNVLRTYPRASLTAPWTWGMQRIEYASWILEQDLCDSAMGSYLPSLWKFLDTVNCPGKARTLWMSGRKRKRSLQRIQRAGADDVGHLAEPLRPEKSEKADCGHDLGPVDQREPLFGLEE